MKKLKNAMPINSLGIFSHLVKLILLNISGERSKLAVHADIIEHASPQEPVPNCPILNSHSKDVNKTNLMDIINTKYHLILNKAIY